MVNGAVDSCASADDFRLQYLYARIQFVDRERIEILLGKRDERVAGCLGKEVFQVHKADR